MNQYTGCVKTAYPVCCNFEYVSYILVRNLTIYRAGVFIVLTTISSIIICFNSDTLIQILYFLNHSTKAVHFCTSYIFYTKYWLMYPVLNVKSNMVELDTRHILWAAFGVSLKLCICICVFGSKHFICAFSLGLILHL